MNLEDIARMSGVSRSTVSRVINGEARVSEEARRRVQAVIAETNFQPNAAARSLVTRRSRMLGLVFPTAYDSLLADPWSSVLIKGCLAGARDIDYSLILMLESTEDQTAVDRIYERMFNGRHLDGIIVATHRFGDALVPRLKCGSVPYIVIGRDESRTANFIEVDNRAASRAATSHLIAHGHRSIVHFTGPDDLITARDRQDGYFDALERAGIPPEEGRVVAAEFSQFHAYEAAHPLLGSPDRPTAICAGNDSMAIGIIQAAREVGLDVPDDLAVVGFDDIEVNRTYGTDLTTIRQPTEEMGRLAVRRLAEMIEHPPHAPVREWLAADLVLRGSCGCPSIRRVPGAHRPREEELSHHPAQAGLIVQG